MDEAVVFEDSPFAEYLSTFGFADEAADAVRPASDDGDEADEAQSNGSLLEDPETHVETSGSREAGEGGGGRGGEALVGSLAADCRRTLQALVVQQLHILHGRHSGPDSAGVAAPGPGMHRSSALLARPAALGGLALSAVCSASAVAVSSRLGWAVSGYIAVASAAMAAWCTRIVQQGLRLDQVARSIRASLSQIAELMAHQTRSVHRTLQSIQETETVARGYRLGARAGAAVARIDVAAKMRHHLRERSALRAAMDIEYSCAWTLLESHPLFGQLQEAIRMETQDGMLEPADPLSILGLRARLAHLCEARLALFEWWLADMHDEAFRGRASGKADTLRHLRRIASQLAAYRDALAAAIDVGSSPRRARVDPDSLSRPAPVLITGESASASKITQTVRYAVHEMATKLLFIRSQIDGDDADQGQTANQLQPWTEQELDEALGTLAFQLAELSADCERTRQLMRRGELSSLVQPSLDSESSSAMIHHTHMPHADAGEDMGVVFDAKTDGNPLLAVDETFEWQDDDAVEQDKTARPPRPKLDRQERIRLQREQREIQTRQRAAQAARIEVISELSSVLRHRQTAKGGEPGAARPK